MALLRQRGAPAELYYWLLSCGKVHVYRHCHTAFYENPVGFGGLRGVALPENMRTARSGLRLAGRQPCVVCAVRWHRYLDGDNFDA